MNWDAVVAIAEVVGAVTVIASLGYVALQVKQNTRATRYQTTQNMITANSDANFLISADGELAEILHKGCYKPESLTGTERLRFNTWFFAYYNHFDFAYHQYIAGQLDEVMWQKMAFEMPLYVSSLPGVTEWWSKDKARMSKEFVAYMDERMANIDPSSSLPTINSGTRENAS